MAGNRGRWGIAMTQAFERNETRGRGFRGVILRLMAAGALAMALLAGQACGESGTQGAPAKPQAVWNLKDLYPSAAAWKSEYDKISRAADELANLKGTLSRDAKSMLGALERMSEVYKQALRLAIYASLKFDENRGVGENSERNQLGQTLLTKIDAATSWVNPEILATGEAKVKEFQAAEPKLVSVFGFFLDNVLRAAPHTLGDEAEGVLAAAGDVLNQPNNVYDILASAEMPWKTITLSDGTEVKLDQAMYSKYRQAPNRADRKLVFDTFWGVWKDYEETMGANLNAEIVGNIFGARARKFPNALSAALFGDNMPEAVYRQLVTQVNKALPSFHRYLKLRKRMLGIADELHYYDIYPTLVPALDLKFTLEDSERITLAALAPLGQEYHDIMAEGFAGSWQHVYPQEGKASGAYMNGGAYDVHPYLLLNHNDDYDSLSTFAHEWGHAIHTQLARRNQPFEKADYSTFTAETASIGNEMFLQDYMIRNARTREEKMFYIGEALETTRGTFFRQTMFGEFQLALHEAVEKGEALSGEKITQMYCEILKRYHGEAEGVMKIDEPYCVEWAFIPHFYYGFYVYQYATSMVGAAYFQDQVAKGGEAERENFLNLLRAGGSDYPYELYKRAGLDMAQPEPYAALVARFESLMDQMEELERQPQAR